MATFFRLPPWLCPVIFVVTLAGIVPVRAETAPPSTVTIHRFKRLVFTDSLKAAADLKLPPDAGPVVVRGVGILEGREFQDFLAPYIGRVITTQSVNQLAKDVDAYVRKHDRLVVNVLMPNQDISRANFAWPS